MRYLEYLDLAPCFLLSECAHWLAFGRLPSASYTDERSGPARDYRQQFDVILDHGRSPFDVELYFNSSTLVQLLPGIDPLEYHRQYLACVGRSPEMVKEERAMLADSLAKAIKDVPESGSHPEYRAAAGLDNDYELTASIWLERAQVPLKRMIERAQTEVFQSLADGKLRALALLMPNDLDNEDAGNHYPDEFTEIPQDAWTYTGINWESGNLETMDGTFLSVTVESTEFLRHHPLPRLTPELVSGNLYGETFIPLDGALSAESTNLRVARRGAPTSGENILRDALVREFELRLSTGKLPEKTESIISEAQGWVETRLGVPLARTTAQRYLDPVLKRLPRKPAHK